MTQIGFYHLTRTSLSEALPQLLTRTLDSGQKAVVWCADKPLLEELDKTLWQVATPRWLPHGSAGIACPDLQPVWLSTGEDCPNEARFLFLTQNRQCTDPTRFERIFDLFDGHDETAVAAARERWAQAHKAGHELAYWRQEDRGWKRAR
ncbi:DNA polymerase III subunit chi [Acetobacter okinawensis]|uniref:DNA polymerase III subunit chi n=1 Tax=Acetobacter okinawensis TaxID=1076594 RepID=UPI0004710DAA|nr:DNA polymerase III subunit chi [Acetobacter okinawensis]MBS0966048.1 DNA polymerase III subunit chi [Acetobacter okinawensis]MBS0989925.1 DNA polymerase III subunit chi [Acetobacter okinawensis]MCP1212148.1 DNA polymerase III subunit chi [Acetobacter okinawensis]